jgi:hypothetical protein
MTAADRPSNLARSEGDRLNQSRLFGLPLEAGGLRRKHKSKAQVEQMYYLDRYLPRKRSDSLRERTWTVCIYVNPNARELIAVRCAS